MKKLNLAVIGQGRSGKDIHGSYYLSASNEFYNVKYVVEKDERRRAISQERYPNCIVLDNYKKLFDYADIDLVVNASYSYMHFEITKALLEQGLNVLCEKPFVRNRYECDLLTSIAKKKGVVLAVFQQTFLSPMYVETKKLIESGKLGEIQQISIRYNGFSRRWDWQTLQKKMAGSTYNTGPHPLGVALGLLDFSPHWRLVYSKLASTPLTSGDADDYCKAILTASGYPVVDVEISSLDAFSSYNIKLQGTKGSYKCTTTNYQLKYVVEGENPARPVQEDFLQDEKGNPLYCWENLITHEESGNFNGTAFDVGTAELYKNLYFAITQGKPLAVDMSQARQVVSLIEQIYASNPLPVKF